MIEKLRMRVGSRIRRIYGWRGPFASEAVRRRRLTATYLSSCGAIPHRDERGSDAGGAHQAMLPTAGGCAGAAQKLQPGSLATTSVLEPQPRAGAPTSGMRPASISGGESPRSSRGTHPNSVHSREKAASRSSAGGKHPPGVSAVLGIAVVASVNVARRLSRRDLVPDSNRGDNQDLQVAIPSGCAGAPR